MSRMTLRDENGFNQGYAPVGSTPLRLRRRNDWIVAEIRRRDARRVLELGCGTGETAGYLAAQSTAEIVAVDISASFLAEARGCHQAANLHFEQFDLLGDQPLAVGRFDLICGNESCTIWCCVCPAC